MRFESHRTSRLHHAIWATKVVCVRSSTAFIGDFSSERPSKRALWSDRQNCSHHVSHKSKRVRLLFEEDASVPKTLRRSNPLYSATAVVFDYMYSCPALLGVSQKGSRERCLPVFFLKMKRKKTEENGKNGRKRKKRKEPEKTEENGKNGKKNGKNRKNSKNGKKRKETERNGKRRKRKETEQTEENGKQKGRKQKENKEKTGKNGRNGRKRKNGKNWKRHRSGDPFCETPIFFPWENKHL